MRGSVPPPRRALLPTAVLAVLVGVAGCASGSTDSSRAPSTGSTAVPATGRIAPAPWSERQVTVDGATLWVSCRGEGPKTVVFVAGLAESATSAWLASGVPDFVADQARVCVYDRPGLGHSESSPQPPTVEHHVADLAALVEQGALPAPVVLVGQGYSTFVTRAFAKEHLKLVAGMVLVDPPLEVLSGEAPAGATAGQLAEYQSIADLDANLGAYGAGALPAPPVPTIVLGAGDEPALPPTVPAGGPTTASTAVDPSTTVAPDPDAGAHRRDLQRQLAKKSPFGSFRTVDGTGAYIQFWLPRAVADAVGAVLADPRAP